MMRHDWIKKGGVVTLVFFCWFLFATNYQHAAEEDSLLKARSLYQQGDYEAAINLLTDFIQKLKAIVAQKKNVAEAFYLLAKVYYTVGEDEKTEANIRKVFETFPPFEKEESDLEFRERVDKVRGQMTQPRVIQPRATQPQRVAEPAPERQVIETPAVKKKKKFPWIVVVLGVAVIAVVAFLVLGKKKEESAVTDVTLRMDVNFAATNLRCRHIIRVNGMERFNEEMQFNVPSSNDYDDAVKLDRAITLSLPPGSFTIEHEVMPDYDSFFPGNVWIWATNYRLTITSHNFTGDDPGRPTLAETEFEFKVAPWREDPSEEWYRIKSKVIAMIVPQPPPARTARTSGKGLSKIRPVTGKRN